MDLRERTVLITGGTSGIGLELVKKLACGASTVVVLSRDPNKLIQLTQAFGNVKGYPCSLDNAVELEATIKTIRQNHPELSVVINNAGIQDTPTFLDTHFQYSRIEYEIAVNLTAPIKICALMLPHMLSLGCPSAFVNITSGLAIYPKKSSAVYCATKAGLHNFSRSLRYQLETTRISVHDAILPIVDTPMTKGRGRGKLSAEKAAESIIRGVTRGREEIYVGKARFIPALARLSPSLLARIMKSG